jgi:hypothetical protein
VPFKNALEFFALLQRVPTFFLANLPNKAHSHVHQMAEYFCCVCVKPFQLLLPALLLLLMLCTCRKTVTAYNAPNAVQLQEGSDR